MKKSGIVLLLLIILKFVLTFLLAGSDYDLHRDEFLHLDQGHHLAWGYISVPPFTSWVSVLIHALGGGYFWVKFFPALFGALTILLVWQIVHLLHGGLFAKICASTAILLSVMMRLNILYQPNSFDVFFWTLLYFCLLKYFVTTQIRWIYFSALALAFGVLAKYNIVFLLFGLAPALLISRHRKIFLQKHFYLALLLAALIVLPNFLWQVKNHFPTLSQLKELQQSQLVNESALGFLSSQLLSFANSILVLGAAFAGLLFYRPFAAYRFMLWSFLICILLFVLLKAKGYYAYGLYPALMAFGAVYLEHLFKRKAGRWLRPLVIVFIVAGFYPMLRTAFPYVTPQEIVDHPEVYKKFGLLRWEDGKDHELPQDFADMRGWRELAAITDSAWLLAQPLQTIVIAGNYGEAGAINYYTKQPGLRVVSFNADYINWFQLDKPIVNLILVLEAGGQTPQDIGIDRAFTSMQVVGKVQDTFARERGTTVYLLKTAKGDFNEMLRQRIAQEKLAYSQKR